MNSDTQQKPATFAEAERLRVEHHLTWEKCLKHSMQRGITYPEAVAELASKGGKA